MPVVVYGAAGRQRRGLQHLVLRVRARLVGLQRDVAGRPSVGAAHRSTGACRPGDVAVCVRRSRTARRGEQGHDGDHDQDRQRVRAPAVACDELAHGAGASSGRRRAARSWRPCGADGDVVVGSALRCVASRAAAGHVGPARREVCHRPQIAMPTRLRPRTQRPTPGASLQPAPAVRSGADPLEQRRAPRGPW